MRIVLLIPLALAVAPLLAAPSLAHGVCPAQPVHSYALPGAVLVGTPSLPLYKVGFVEVTDTNLVDCDLDGVPGDYDGDYDVGLGGGFFGWGPWAAAAACNYNLHVHGPDVKVFDATGLPVLFEIGADDITGPIIVPDPITGGALCETDGVISPGADADDCLTTPYVSPGPGKTCGAGGDGGYWVILDAPGVDVVGGAVVLYGVPTVGTITAGFFGAPLNPPMNGNVQVDRT